MTSKERVLALFDHKVPDRCPIDFRSTAEMETRLIEALGLANAEELRCCLGSDIRIVKPAFKQPNLGGYYSHRFVREVGEGRYADSWGITWQRMQMPSGDVFYEVVDSPLRSAASATEIEAYPWPDPEQDWDFSNLRASAQGYSEYAVAGKTAAVFDDAWRMLGFEKMLTDMYVNPEVAEAALRKTCDYWLKQARLQLEAAGGALDLMWLCDDLGTQNGLLMAPDVCRRFVIPLVKERADLFRRYGARVLMHCCGGIAPIIADLIEAGVEALNPIQCAAKGMDRRELKRRHGDRLIFHGSVDQQRIMVPGTPEDVIRDTQECIDILGENGGYIAASSHVIEMDIPVENVKALFLTAQEYGEYPTEPST